MSRPDVSSVAAVWVDPEDEALAIRLNIPVLISADAAHVIDAIASRIHVARFGSMKGFTRAAASTFPFEAQPLLQHCSSLLHLAREGTLFIPDIDQLPLKIQHVLLESLATPGLDAEQRIATRLITGTTAPLWDRVQRGAFYEPLFYRLNTIHIVVGGFNGNEV
jgi:transcriptional regulator of aromatic amino acid metabolism